LLAGKVLPALHRNIDISWRDLNRVADAAGHLGRDYRRAETMAAYGIPEADIARVLGVSKPTLRKHCGTELDTGATRANSKVADFLFYGICGGTGKPAFKDERARVTAAIFWMKTRGGWSETSTHKHTGVANGDPIEVEVGTVRERLMRRIARIAAPTTTRGRAGVPPQGPPVSSTSWRPL
jgi:hypothetical protein